MPAIDDVPRDRLPDPHRRAGVRRDAGVGRHHDRPRRGRRPPARPGSATPTATPPRPASPPGSWPAPSSAATRSTSTRRGSPWSARSATTAARAGSPGWRSPRWTWRCTTCAPRLLDVPLATAIGRFHDPRADLRLGRLLLLRRRAASRPSSAGGPPTGIPRVKMKVGREPGPRPPPPRGGARRHRPADVELYVDANGAYERPRGPGLGADVRRPRASPTSRSRSAPTTSDGLRPPARPRPRRAGDRRR